MPFFNFRCTACGAEFEALVRSGEAAACPSCGAATLDKLVGAAPALGGQTKAMIGKARAKAASEGHFSNYSRSELKKS